MCEATKRKDVENEVFRFAHESENLSKGSEELLPMIRARFSDHPARGWAERALDLIVRNREVVAEVERLAKLPEHENAWRREESFQALRAVVLARFTDLPERRWAEWELDREWDLHNCKGA